jgi:hypothetical protein
MLDVEQWAKEEHDRKSKSKSLARGLMLLSHLAESESLRVERDPESEPHFDQLNAAIHDLSKTAARRWATAELRHFAVSELERRICQRKGTKS